MNRTLQVNTAIARPSLNSSRIARICLAYAAAGALALLAWQAATVHFNYNGNLTALFCTGSAFPPPPELAHGTYVFPASSGFDGQFYRYVAHDPWIQRGWRRYHDLAVLRDMRILVPAMAWLLAFGRDAYIDAAYIAVILLWTFLGIYWLGRLAALHSRNPAWGLGFLLTPATLISGDRLTVDVALTALCAGVLWHAANGSTARLYLLLLAAPLVRDTGLLLVAACCAYALARRLWARAALLATATLPVFAWYFYVASRLSPLPHLSGPLRFFEHPVIGIVLKLFHPEPYGFAPLLNHVIQAFDFLALAGFLIVFGFGAAILFRRPYTTAQWITMLFLLQAVAFSRSDYWANVYDYSRPLSPLVLTAALQARFAGPAWVLFAVVLLDLRIGLQWGPQILGVLRGVF